MQTQPHFDADLERLYEEWEENDDEPLPDDEKPEHLRPRSQISLDDLKKQAKSPEDMLRLSKKGQSIMMFVSVVDPATRKKPIKEFTEALTTRWQSNLYNNHIDAQVYVVEDDRALFMFKEGSQAWEARDFLLKQAECAEISLEGQSIKGPGSIQKNEL
uniref:LDLR chaperone boca n=1 Tax=Acrobeloides nanus TaxID=290746 RepID=A0A914D0C3_9BILA